MPTQTQPWLRAELIAAPETTPGAQLMIPADGVEFHDDQLVFHHQGDIVYVAPQGQLRSITWFAKQPNPETARRKAQWPKHGTRWSDEERADLLRHLRNGHSWKAISHAHGRSRTGCQQEAIKQGWLDSETLQPTPALLLVGPDPEPAAKSDSESTAAPTDAPTNVANASLMTPATDALPNAAASPAPANHGLVTGASADPKPAATPADAATESPVNAASDPVIANPRRKPTSADATRKATLADTPANSPQSAPATPAPTDTASPLDGVAAGTSSQSPQSAPAKPVPTGAASPLNAVPADTSANLLQSTPATSALADTASPPNAALGNALQKAATSSATAALADPLQKAALVDTSAWPPPNTPVALALADSLREPAFTGLPPEAMYIPVSARPSPSATSSPEAGLSAAIAPETLASATAAPQPDRPRIPPRVPRQRTSPENRPAGADADKDSDPGPAPGSAGSRFLSRAQSSLARATLGAYMNPPRSQADPASGAT